MTELHLRTYPRYLSELLLAPTRSLGLAKGGNNIKPCDGMVMISTSVVVRLAYFYIDLDSRPTHYPFIRKGAHLVVDILGDI